MNAKKIAKERIKILLELADKIFKENRERAKRYVELARKISMRHNVRIPREYRFFICKGCKTLLKPGVNARFRIYKSKIVVTCLECGNIYRMPFLFEKKFRKMRKKEIIDVFFSIDKYDVFSRNSKKTKFGIYFELYVKKGRNISPEPIATVIYFRGKGYIKPWIEVDYKRFFKIRERKRKFGFKGEVLFFKKLSEILGVERVMVSYYSDKETSRELAIGIPEIITKLGYILFKAGFYSLKDFYVPEGGAEGKPKIIAERIPEKKDEIIGEWIRILEKFLEMDYEEKYKKRAKKVLKELKKIQESAEN